MVKYNHIKTIYVAGPYRGHFFKKIANIMRARRYARQVWGLGYAVICPHSNSAFFDEFDTFLLPAYISIMLRCDAVLVVPGYEKSKGTIAELEAAESFGMPVCYSIQQLLNVPVLRRE